MNDLILKSYDSKTGESVSRKHLEKVKDFLQEVHSYSKPGYMFMLVEPLYYMDGQIEYIFNKANIVDFPKHIEEAVATLDRLGDDYVYLCNEDTHNLVSILGLRNIQVIAEVNGFPRVFLRSEKDRILTLDIIQECMPRSNFPVFLVRTIQNESMYLRSTDPFADLVIGNIKADDRLGLINDFDAVVDLTYAITRRYHRGQKMDGSSKKRYVRDTFRVYQFNPDAPVLDHVYTSEPYKEYLKTVYDAQAVGHTAMAQNTYTHFERMKSANRLWKPGDPELYDDDI